MKYFCTLFKIFLVQNQDKIIELEQNPPSIEKRRIAILGSTGSIGTQALEVIKEQSDFLQANLLCANNSWELLVKQAIDFQPEIVIIGNDDHYLKVKDALAHLEIKVFSGFDSITQCMELDCADMVLTAMVGFAGLESTIAAIKSKKAIALANKETLVVAGQIIMEMAREYQVPILPVDSEHSAIYQCIQGEDLNSISRLILTASGGPFRGKKLIDLENITKQNALKHPNWAMGAKITIDSSTLMNKGLELIEAKWLFGMNPSQMEVIVHPQSVIHSMVEFSDSSIKAQLGYPDMKLPIQYALCYPYRTPNHFRKFNFLEYPSLTFESPDLGTFKCLQIGMEAMKKAGNAPCIMNAANEVAVELFLQDKIRFLQIPEIIEKAVDSMDFVANPDLKTLHQTDKNTREFVKNSYLKN